VSNYFEGDIEAADIEGDGAAFISTPQGAVSVPVRTKVNWASSIRGRLGYAVGRRLLYATGGWALADIDNTGQVASLSPFFTPSTSHAGGMIGGWTAGGGFESFVTRRLTVRIEYRHTSFDAKGFGFSLIHNDPNDVTDPSTRIAVDARKLELDSIRVGLSYKFLP